MMHVCTLTGLSVLKFDCKVTVWLKQNVLTQDVLHCTPIRTPSILINILYYWDYQVCFA